MPEVYSRIAESASGERIALSQIEESASGGRIALSQIAESASGGRIALSQIAESASGGRNALSRIAESALGDRIALSRIAESASGDRNALSPVWESRSGAPQALSRPKTFKVLKTLKVSIKIVRAFCINNFDTKSLIQFAPNGFVIIKIPSGSIYDVFTSGWYIGDESFVLGSCCSHYSINEITRPTRIRLLYEKIINCIMPLKETGKAFEMFEQAKDKVIKIAIDPHAI